MSAPSRPGNPPNGRRPGEFIRTLPVVAFLTVLIWVYAERANTRDDTLTVQFDLEAADPNLDVAVVGASDDRLAITVNGPRGQIEQLRNRIESAAFAGRIRIPLSSGESSAGEKSIDLAARLNDTPLIKNSGVSVTKTSPVQVRAVVDPIIPREVTVVLPRELPVTLQSYSFSPQKLTVKGPTAVINREFATENPTIAVDISSLRSIETVREQSREVPVVLPADGRIHLSQNKVKMAFEIGSTIREEKVRTVAILIERPLGDEGKYKVVMRKGPVINNVGIRGPANLVAKYGGDQPEVALKAVLPVTQADIGHTDITRAVTFPYKEAGITVLNEPIEVQFDVIDLNQ
ncbi:MAG: hypothetical protein QM754_14970 [Tepidisphaeraceae bacterium]